MLRVEEDDLIGQQPTAGPCSKLSDWPIIETNQRR